MTHVSTARSAEIGRAVVRAREVLQPGDKLSVGTCGGRVSNVTMVGWSESFPGFITSKTLVDDELHPINVRKVNGVPTSFADPQEIG